MNTAAVKAWEQKLSSVPKLISSRAKRQRRRRRRLGANIDRTNSDTAVPVRRHTPQHISETPSHKAANSTSPNLNKNIPSVVEQTASHSPFNPPNITVQVSQHSSFNRDLYVAYQSSLSTGGTSSLLLSHPNSGLEELSSPPRTTHSPVDSDGIIPDSQSLPGSSSYRPASSTSLAVLRADQTPLSHNNTDLETPTGGVPEANNSIEDSSAVVVETSQPSVIAFVRSRSEPTPSIELSSASSFGAQLRSLPRSTSDPTCTYHSQHQRQNIVSELPCDNHIRQYRVIQGSADLQSPHQTQAGYTQQRQRSPEVQVPGSADRNSHDSHTVDDSQSQSLVFQTQVPLAFASQGCRVSVTSAGTFSSDPILLQ